MIIERIKLHRLRVALSQPYGLSFGPVHAFDTVLVELRDREGRCGLGEATYLTGYTDETIDGGWLLAQQLGVRYATLDTDEIEADLRPYFDSAAFTATAFNTALEMLREDTLLSVKEIARVPLLGLLNATESGDIEREAGELRERGFAVFKVKVGFDADRDSAMVKRIQRALNGTHRLRLDANQGYERDDACRFAANLDPEGIELFEQPCAAGDWESAQAVARVASVPMMLDESIYALADIRRAAELDAARYIKVKLMKFGGVRRLTEAIATIRSHGMQPVLGNGVANEIGCWMEACVARGRIDNAGEMNGFLKPAQRLLKSALKFEDGAILLEPGFAPELDAAAIARCQVAAAEF